MKERRKLFIVGIVCFVIGGVTYGALGMLFGSKLQLQSKAKANYDEEYSKQQDLTNEYILRYSSALGDDARSSYTIASGETGVVVAGETYCSEYDAYKHPLIIQSDEALTLALKDNENRAISVRLQPGKSGIYPQNGSAEATGYIYVTMKMSEVNYDEEYAKQKEVTNDYILQYSSAIGKDAKSSYVLTSQKGVVIAGKTYISEYEAYMHPLIIQSDENLTLALKDTDFENLTTSCHLGPGDSSQLYPIVSGNSTGYIYVIMDPAE